MLPRIPLLRTLLVFVAFCGLSLFARAEATADFPFITRQGDRLMEGDKEFRFVSFNHPNLHISENPTWRRMTAWEQEDAIRSIAQMGGQVVRIYTLSVKGGRRNGDGLSHVYGPGHYDEELLRDYDQMIALCRKYRVRLMIPFIDEWDWFGGIDEFSRFRGKTRKEFYTDPQIQEDFRALVKMLVTRVNTVTGIPYNEDPTIMVWESGNELGKDPEEWVVSLAAYVKSLAPKQLFQDGHCDVRPLPLQDPNVDLLTAHYYHQNHVYAETARKHRERSKGIKPFYVGEYDARYGAGLIDEVIANGSAGILAWGLRGHKQEGGFFFHFDPLFFHWPYSPITREVRTASYRIQGLPEPALPVPAGPELLPIASPRAINWRGSTGADRYTLERASTAQGPWQRVAEGVRDDKNELPLFVDESAPAEGPLYYRLQAGNESGVSPWSTAVPVSR